MSEYIRRSDGPGSIGALLPGAALWHAPTIGANDPRRNISDVSNAARGITSLGGCGCGGGCGSCGSMGTDGETTTSSLPSWAGPVALLALIGGGMLWLKRSKSRDEQAETLARYYY